MQQTGVRAKDVTTMIGARAIVTRAVRFRAYFGDTILNWAALGLIAKTSGTQLSIVSPK